MEGNAGVNLAARIATEEGRLSERKLPLLKSMALESAANRLKHASQKFSSNVEIFTRSLDYALPTKKLCDRLSRDRSSMLRQLRARKNKLNLYLAKAKMIEPE